MPPEYRACDVIFYYSVRIDELTIEVKPHCALVLVWVQIAKGKCRMVIVDR